MSGMNEVNGFGTNGLMPDRKKRTMAGHSCGSKPGTDGAHLKFRVCR